MTLFAIAAVPAQAASNPTLGDLNPATPSANKYAGCVASVLTGSGVTFGSTASLGAELAAVWSSLPAGVADACKKAVDTNQPQVCVNPADPTTCPAIGAAAAASLTDQALAVPGTWKLVTDGVGTGGYAQTALPTGGASSAAATLTGTFTTPVYVCTTKDCGSLPPTGLFTDCGPTSCGPVTAMSITVIGRTGANGVKGHLHAVDGFGHVTDVVGLFGNSYWGYGCGAGDCHFGPDLVWNCQDFQGLPANCGGQTLTVSFTFDSGVAGGCGCVAPPSLGQFAELTLTAANLAFAQNPTVCSGNLDCLRYDDSRLSYLDGSSRPTAVQYPGAATPSAVLDLASANLGCLVGLDVTKSPSASCVDVTGAVAPLLQTAHPTVAPAPPPTVAAAASPSGAPSGWEKSTITVTLTASDGIGPGVSTITYSATGAQAIPATVVPASTAQVSVTADGSTTVNAWATDVLGSSGPAQSLTVKLDHSAPTATCAAAPAGWSAGDVSIACSASDGLSGLADTTQAGFSLTTSVAAGTETLSASTNSTTVCDLAGNCAAAGPVSGIKVDRKAPSITCAAPPTGWSAGDVSIACSANDGVSGLADPNQAQFSLTTSVAAGTATASGTTNSVSVCDAAGNCATAGPVGGIKVDRVAPAIVCAAAPTTWSGGDVIIPCSASDAMSGLANPAQALFSLTTSVPAGTETSSAATNSVSVCDAAGNCAIAGPFSGLQVDRRAPSISCAAAPTTWSAGDISIACTASDGLSGLANPIQATFSLTTAVAAGTETGSAATNSATVCDLAANCATAGPIGGLKVDRRAPSITIAAPAGTYSLRQVVNAAYTCSDGGSGVATCAGSQLNGKPLDTAAAGVHTLTVDATDAAGNHAKLVATYTVTAAPAPPPVCSEVERARQLEGRHDGERCEDHGVAVRPIATPKPAPKPTPKPTHKPAAHGSDEGDGKGDNK